MTIALIISSVAAVAGWALFFIVRAGRTRDQRLLASNADTIKTLTSDHNHWKGVAGSKTGDLRTLQERWNAVSERERKRADKSLADQKEAQRRESARIAAEARKASEKRQAKEQRVARSRATASSTSHSDDSMLNTFLAASVFTSQNDDSSSCSDNNGSSYSDSGSSYSSYSDSGSSYSDSGSSGGSDCGGGGGGE